MKIKNLLFTAIFATALISCSNDDDNIPNLGDYANGAIILNEGGFGNANASVSFLPEDFSEIQNNIFSATNGTSLGDVAQSIGFNNNEAFIVVNNSNKVEVVDRYTFESITSITTGLENPRYFTVAGNKGYISNWGDPFDAADDFIAVIDLSNYSVESTIPVAEGPERLIFENGKIFVSHKGGYSNNNVLTVIEGENISEITVNDNPDEMIVDQAGNLWVLSGGIEDWSGDGNDTAGAISKINTSTNEVVQTMGFEVSNHPSLMAYDNGSIYYTAGGGVYKMETSATSLPSTSIISGSFYGMNTHNGKLYATDAGNFSSQGQVMVFDLSTSDEIATFNAGIGPNQIYFNN